MTGRPARQRRRERRQPQPCIVTQATWNNWEEGDASLPWVLFDQRSGRKVVEAASVQDAKDAARIHFGPIDWDHIANTQGEVGGTLRPHEDCRLH